MVQLWRDGNDVVYGLRIDRQGVVQECLGFAPKEPQSVFVESHA